MDQAALWMLIWREKVAQARIIQNGQAVLPLAVVLSGRRRGHAGEVEKKYCKHNS
jgi:hypothetical protein